MKTLLKVLLVSIIYLTSNTTVLSQRIIQKSPSCLSMSDYKFNKNEHKTSFSIFNGCGTDYRVMACVKGDKNQWSCDEVNLKDKSKSSKLELRFFLADVGADILILGIEQSQLDEYRFPYRTKDNTTWESTSVVPIIRK